MLTETAILRQSRDTPWRRLRWTLPMSLLIWVLALWSLAYFMEKPTHRQAEQAPIEARFFELPAPEPISKPEQEIVVPKPLPTPRPRPTTPEKIQVAPTPVRERPAITQTLPQTEAPAPMPESSAPASTPKIDVVASPSAPPSTHSATGQGRDTTNTIVNSGARAIVRPMPKIPDDLREETLNAKALARFHIAVDGNVTVELAKATPNPRLNRILLDTLKTWRFPPAIKDGIPAASTEEIAININVD